jgi:hypothetical protein
MVVVPAANDGKASQRCHRCEPVSRSPYEMLGGGDTGWLVSMVWGFVTLLTMAVAGTAVDSEGDPGTVILSCQSSAENQQWVFGAEGQVCLGPSERYARPWGVRAARKHISSLPLDTDTLTPSAHTSPCPPLARWALTRSCRWGTALRRSPRWWGKGTPVGSRWCPVAAQSGRSSNFSTRRGTTLFAGPAMVAVSTLPSTRRAQAPSSGSTTRVPRAIVRATVTGMRCLRARGAPSC